MNILKTLLGVLIPTLSKEKAKISAIDSLISKKDNASQLEVMTALIYKYLRLALYAYLIISTVNGNISIVDVLKSLAINM